MKQRKIIFTLFTILSIVGYGTFVFAITPVPGETVQFVPGETLDPTNCKPGDTYCSVQMAVSIGSSVVSGIPNQVLYTDADGKVFGDSLFTRDSTTGNTIIGVANGVVASSMSILNTGNTLTWDADTTDNITTRFEQSQDILGLGALSGSALTWRDSGTQVSGLIGTVDGSGVGLFPGSTIMSTTNGASLASASLSTNYDTLGLQATLIANVGNGPGDTGFEFDRTGGIIRSRDQGTGFESAFEVNGNNASAKYTLNGTNEYQTQLGDGTFAFLNTTTGDKYLSLDSVTGIMKIAPPTGGDFEVNTLTTNKVAFTVIPDNFYVKMGDGDNVANHTSLTVDDASQAIIFGYTGSSYTFPIGDGSTDYLLATDGLGQLFWQDPTMVPSDRSLKQNINSLSYGLDTLMQLNPVSYTMNSTGKEQIGFIAQEVESLVPELVGDVANGKKGLAYGQMTAVIVKSVQEMNLKITDIENFASAKNKTFLNSLIAWLGDVGNGIGKLFANEIETKTLCIADDAGNKTCLNKDQIDQVLQNGISNSFGYGYGGN